MKNMTREHIANTYKQIQQKITDALEQLDGGARFVEENWQRDGGGGGRTRVIQHGAIFEKGGVNFSEVHGKLPEPIRKSFGVDEDEFFATGVSIVIHPNNPWVPIIHMNIRYFELNDQVKWFGGGIDLTPHYVDQEDAQYFHQSLKDVCDKHHPEFYAKYKAWADRYFYIKHRQETRGIGGIFYDKITPQNTELSYEEIFDFSCDLGRLFPKVYSELVNKSRHKTFTEQEKNWQLLRRGRYVEFNLVYDSGTKFGLETNGRIESILMSLPEQANWFYNYQAEPGSREEQTLSLLKQDIAWV